MKPKPVWHKTYDYMCLQHLELNTLRKHAYILLLAFVLPRFDSLGLFNSRDDLTHSCLYSYF